MEAATAGRGGERERGEKRYCITQAVATAAIVGWRGKKGKTKGIGKGHIVIQCVLPPTVTVHMTHCKLQKNRPAYHQDTM